MKKLGLLVFAIHALNAQTFSPCDVNHDGAVNIADVQTMINEALGVSACTTDLSGDGKCDVIDVQIVITAALGGACDAAPPSAPSNIQLPVEVIGLDGTIKSVSFNVPTGSNVSGAMQLSLQIHGLHYQTQASVRLNNSAWMPINNTSVTLLGLANAYGGIGGGFHTFKLTMNVPSGAITTGTNSISFRFNGTDGRASGFRVLAFNLHVNGDSLIPSSTFVWEDPNTWKPPSTLASDIAAGKALWYTAPLTVPRDGSTPILAHCTDCHAQDGRDLKYFNYSNNSIHVRSMFHGLTAQQGDQIASYIRTLNVPNPGRPYNPPYQPGPGMDLLPVVDWAAGAGINAVLDHDADMLPYLMPGGSTANWAPLANLSAREIPVTMQFPDWNMWLPSVHPMDGFGSAFLTSDVYTNYLEIRANLVPNDPVSYSKWKTSISLWGVKDTTFLNPLTKSETDPAWSNPVYAASIPSMRMWSMTKNWEINQEFGLEGMAQTAFGPQADSRAWYSGLPFFGSPNMMHLPNSAVGNALPVTYDYMSQIWYQVQLVLNASNNRGTHLGPSSDWPYVYNHIDALTWSYSPAISPQALLVTLWAIKGLQASENGNGPEFGSSGWALNVNDPTRFVEYGFTKWDNSIAPTDKINILSTYAQLWLSKVTSFTPTQFYTGGWAAPTDPIQNTPTGFVSGRPNLGSRIAYTIPMLGYYGVSSTITNQMIAWAKTVWPTYNWASIKSAVCTAGPWDPVCTW